jgi:hypothetical protein
MLSEFLKNILKSDNRNNEKDSQKNSNYNKMSVAEAEKVNLSKEKRLSISPTPAVKSLYDSTANSELNKKFVIKHINLIIFITYLTIFLSTISLFLYFNNVINQTSFIKNNNKKKSDYTKIEIEKIVENYLIERRKLNTFFYYNKDNNFNEENIYR